MTIQGRESNKSEINVQCTKLTVDMQLMCQNARTLHTSPLAQGSLKSW